MPTAVVGTPIGSSFDGGRLTISAILRQPTFVQAYLLRMINELFIGEKIFRGVQDCPSGVAVYRSSVPLFTPETSEELQEFEEIPAVLADYGLPQPAFSRRLGLAVKVSEQMRTRNDVDALNIQLRQVTNTLIRDFDGRFMGSLGAAVPTSHIAAAAATWIGTTSDTVRKDIALAANSITSENRGFRPDTIIIDQSTVWDLLANPNVWEIYRGNVAGANPQLQGFDPNSGRMFNALGAGGKLLGLDVFVTINGNIPAGSAYVCERKVFGGISNERRLRATPWYPQREKESWRSDVTRAAAYFVDQPLALATITGVR